MERPRRPIRIILVRHGQSEGNLDEKKYCTTADSKIRLTKSGLAQAETCGKAIRDIIEKTSQENDWQEETRMALVKDERIQFGRFFYRFPEGESGADVFDRVTSFLESLWRDIDTYRLNRSHYTDLNLVIISHGLTMRIFLMRWFKWTVEQFELLNNPKNCEIRVMQLGLGGEYSLAVHHSKKELEEWGLTPEMITEQEWRAKANRGQWYRDWPWCCGTFFDHLEGSAPQDSNE
ncbi:hypothetical protein GOP47_0029984 [Adiantum capillus-veneris]|nr:hypothetical protein GOP47_0029984 [Adiantum capillus-veneris]